MKRKILAKVINKSTEYKIKKIKRYINDSLSSYEEKAHILKRTNNSLSQSNDSLQNKINSMAKQIETTEGKLIEIEREAVFK